MRCFWDDRQRLHRPAGEFFNGAMHPPAEHGGRIDAILDAIGSTESPQDYGMEPVQRIHSPDYLEFLQTVMVNGAPQGVKATLSRTPFRSWVGGRWH